MIQRVECRSASDTQVRREVSEFDKFLKGNTNYVSTFDLHSLLPSIESDGTNIRELTVQPESVFMSSLVFNEYPDSVVKEGILNLQKFEIVGCWFCSPFVSKDRSSLCNSERCWFRNRIILSLIGSSEGYLQHSKSLAHGKSFYCGVCCYGMLPGQLKPHTIPCHILKFPEDQSYCVRCFIAAGPVRDFLDSSIIESWHSASHYEICAHNKEKKLLGSRRKCFVQVIFAALLAHPGSLRQNAINQFGGKKLQNPRL